MKCQMYRLDQIACAEQMLSLKNGKEPTQAELKIAIHAAYFAVFGAGCANGADCLIGSTDDDQKSPAWLRVFRNFEHRFAKHQCSNEAELSQY